MSHRGHPQRRRAAPRPGRACPGRPSLSSPPPARPSRPGGRAEPPPSRRRRARRAPRAGRARRDPAPAEPPSPADRAPSRARGEAPRRQPPAAASAWSTYAGSGPTCSRRSSCKRRFTWILLSQNAQVVAVDDKTLTIALVNAGARNSFNSGGSEEILRQAAIDVIGHDWRVESIVDPSAQPGAEPRHTRDPPRPPTRGAGRPRGAAAAAAGRRRAPAAGRAGAAGAEAPRRPEIGRVGPRRDPGHPPGGRSASRPARVTDEDADRDDPDADDHSLGGAELLERELGASIIEEIKHD